MDAFKIEDISPETLETKTIYKKDEEPIENVRQETIILPSYDYGRSQEPLDYVTQIRNKPIVAGNIGCTSFSSPGGTGNVSYTGIGFTPKLLVIQAIYSAENGSMSWGQTDGTTKGAYFQFYLSGAPYYSTTSAILYVRNSAGTSTSANLVSFDNDGFTINWVSVGLGANVMVQCYG